MSFTDVISKIFGNKAQRDMSEVQPIVEKIKAKYRCFSYGHHSLFTYYSTSFTS